MDKKRDDLKPCPFCASEAVINHEVKHYGSHCKCSNTFCDMSKHYVDFNQWQDRIEIRKQGSYSDTVE